jgi:hypothetical protein
MVEGEHFCSQLQTDLKGKLTTHPHSIPRLIIVKLNSISVCACVVMFLEGTASRIVYISDLQKLHLSTEKLKLCNHIEKENYWEAYYYSI